MYSFILLLPQNEEATAYTIFFANVTINCTLSAIANFKENNAAICECSKALLRKKRSAFRLAVCKIKRINANKRILGTY